ncbi:MAG: ATP-binding cassette domain-containing protein [Elusimicrobia bacterium]|nr:ATP-binding cassette domain-containing protein [Elusimicrobiota bacterium]
MKKILEIKNVSKKFALRKDNFFSKQNYFTAVDNVSLSLEENQTLGIVGESGSGKTTLAKLILDIEKPDSGEILIDGKDISSAKGKELKELRRQTQVIFQDPYSSLNPRMNVENIILEPLQINNIAAQEQFKTLNYLLDSVGLSQNCLKKYPHEFSGGQRQRIAIARALALKPKVIIADEPISSLDISIQAQILNLLKEIKDEMRVSYIFISHDLSAVCHISDKIAVMNRASVVEFANTQKLFKNPLHPYTQLLLNSIPDADPENKNEDIQIIQNDLNTSLTCAFAERCPSYNRQACAKENNLNEVEKEHYVKCALSSQKKVLS